MKIIETYTVWWKVPEPNYTMYAGITKEFHTLKSALDFIESEESPDDSPMNIQVSKNQPIDITYTFIRETEDGKETKTITKPLAKWKENSALDITNE